MHFGEHQQCTRCGATRFRFVYTEDDIERECVECTSRNSFRLISNAELEERRAVERREIQRRSHILRERQRAIRGFTDDPLEALTQAVDDFARAAGLTETCSQISRETPVHKTPVDDADREMLAAFNIVWDDDE